MNREYYKEKCEKNEAEEAITSALHRSAVIQYPWKAHNARRNCAMEVTSKVNNRVQSAQKWRRAFLQFSKLRLGTKVPIDVINTENTCIVYLKILGTQDILLYVINLTEQISTTV